MNLTEAEDMKKRWQEYTEELYRKDLNDLDNHNGVVTYLRLIILDCEVKWALGSITMNKASGGDGIPAELFKILKDDAIKCCTAHASKFGKLSSGCGTGKAQFSFQSQRRAMPKNVQTTAQLCSFHMPANLENSAVATGLEKINFRSNPKERQCQRMFKLLQNSTQSHTLAK